MKQWRILPVVFFLVLVIFFGRGLMMGSSFKKLPSVQLGKELPAFELPRLKISSDDLSYAVLSIKKDRIINRTAISREDQTQAHHEESVNESTFTPQLFKGKISLLNVWASWCDACAEEQAFLIQLSQTGIPIYGLNYKDKSEEAFNWLQRWGNPFKAVGLDQEGELAIDLGVYGTPETFLIDQKGIIRLRYAGILNNNAWNDTFAPLIQSLEKIEGVSAK